MKVMLFAFIASIAIAAGAAYVLNSEFQVRADKQFVGSGALLRPNEAGANLVGPNWTGINMPGQKH